MAGTAERPQSSSRRGPDAGPDSDRADLATRSDWGKGQVQVSAVAWKPTAEMDREAWEAAGRKLGAIGRGTQWWIGDWIRYGNSRWGEKYTEAAEITGYDVGSLRNMAWVAAEFDTSLRSDKLTWSHHVILAPLEEDEKRQWVEHAARERLPVSKLRAEVRAASTGAGKATASTKNQDLERSAPKTCPNCGHRLDDPDEG